ncbi:MAG: type II toxin-antitoxin system HicA family toxin [Syntrophobacteraceae bacterium]
MGKLRVLFGKQVRLRSRKSRVASCGFRSSHIVMQKRLSDTTITVPVPDHDELRAGTLQSIIRQSGVPKSEFDS